MVSSLQNSSGDCYITKQMVLIYLLWIGNIMKYDMEKLTLEVSNTWFG